MDDHVPSYEKNSRNVIKGRGKIEVSNNYVLRSFWVQKNVASRQTSFGVRPSRIHFSYKELRGGEMNA